MKDKVIIVGGGLAGLVSSILLQRSGIETTVIERKSYPFHRVCGEYISNEVIPFLNSEGLFPHDLNPSDITEFQLTTVNGKSLKMPLDLGGFGISRFAYDYWLSKIAVSEGVNLLENTVVDEINFEEDIFHVQTRQKGTLTASIVIGAFGKKSILDKKLARPFTQKSYPFIGVKYHIKTDLVPANLVALHNFHKGYCGTSRIQDDTYNLCYLSSRENLKKHGNISDMESSVLQKNPYLKKLFTESDFLFDKPEVINEISFSPKEAVYQHVLMTGDAAGMITPLCGNGMAMAIHGAKIVSDLVVQYANSQMSRTELEQQYTKIWDATFRTRHWAGRKIQGLFGGEIMSNAAVNIGLKTPGIAKFLMRQTHGLPF
jgi:flavin-dependent dehydrogenase